VRRSTRSTDGSGEDVALALVGNRVYVIWANGAAIEYRTAGKIEVLSKSGGFPSLTALPDVEVLAAWEEDNGIQIRSLP